MVRDKGRSGLSTSMVIIIILLFLLGFVMLNWFCIRVFNVDIIDYLLDLASNPPDLGGGL